VVRAGYQAAGWFTVGVYYKMDSASSPQGTGQRGLRTCSNQHDVFPGLRGMRQGWQHIQLVKLPVAGMGLETGSDELRDVTKLYEAVPSNALERLRWLERTRIRRVGKVDDEI